MPQKSETVFSTIISVSHPVKAKITNDLLLIALVEGSFNKYKYTLYYYNLRERSYKGYLRLSDML